MYIYTHTYVYIYIYIYISYIYNINALNRCPRAPCHEEANILTSRGLHTIMRSRSEYEPPFTYDV